MTNDDNNDDLVAVAAAAEQCCEYHITPLAVERNEENIRCPHNPVSYIGGQFSHGYYDTGGICLSFELCSKHYLMIREDMDRILLREMQILRDPEEYRKSILTFYIIIIVSSLMLL